jgi:hypothetical protein
VIGYYVHHVGTGHLHRAQALAEQLGPCVVGLSSHPTPSGWPGDWLDLARDDMGPAPLGVTADGNLHWVPEGDPGLSARMARLSSWFDTARPDLVVSDVSVEVTLLARLHGVPVVSVVLPGDRGDRPHRLAYSVSSGLVAAWPAAAEGMVRGLARSDHLRIHPLGGLSRLPVASPEQRPVAGRRVLVLSGRGGGHPTSQQVGRATADAPEWSWSVLGGSASWTADPVVPLDDADVVVIQAGQSAVADVAARRRPAVVIPADRPFGEQQATGRVLTSGGWPCRVLHRFPAEGWSHLLDEVGGLDGERWAGWCDGDAPGRFADYLESVVKRLRKAG